MTSKRKIGDRVPCRVPQHVRDAGLEVYSTCVGFAYARNGNVENPTPRLSYFVRKDGALISTGRTLKAVRESIAIALRTNEF